MDYLDRPLSELPLAIIDFETTGLSPKTGARVVEVAVTHIEPTQVPSVALDTLIDPQGPVLCTRIHGIDDDDVIGAPLFSEIADDLIRALEGRIVGAFNASFDLRFYSAEMNGFRRGHDVRLPPHLCLMWLRPLLGLGKRCSLSAACEELGLPECTHRASEDALATAHLWRSYVDRATAKGVSNLRQLRAMGTHAYLNSLNTAPYSEADVLAIGRESTSTALKPRAEQPSVGRPLTEKIPVSVPDPYAAIRAYWHALCDAFADSLITPDEVRALRDEQQKLSLAPPEIRAVHARFLADRLTLAAEDDSVNLTESKWLSNLYSALDDLGWAPGARA
jgi:DNA polymerase-3 subunit epsilon